MGAAVSSYWSIVWWQFRQNRTAMFGLAFVLMMFMIAIFAPFIAGSKPIAMKWNGRWYVPAIYESSDIRGMDYKLLRKTAPDIKVIMPPIPYSPNDYNLDEVLDKPSASHILGTDDQGRDVASRMVWGSRVSLTIGFVAVAIYVIIGIFIGAFAGYFGGWVDMVISRVIEVVMCFPTFFLILALLAMRDFTINLGFARFEISGIYKIMFIIGITGWTGVARLVRGEFLKLRSQEFVVAAQAAGASSARIMFRHILPNSLAPVLVLATFGVAAAILVESGLSFLGFGVPSYIPSWGGLLSESRDFMDIAWWLTLAPGFAIFMTITAYNLVGEGLRDAVDPRLRL